MRVTTTIAVRRARFIALPPCPAQRAGLSIQFVARGAARNPVYLRCPRTPRPANVTLERLSAFGTRGTIPLMPASGKARGTDTRMEQLRAVIEPLEDRNVSAVLPLVSPRTVKAKVPVGAAEAGLVAATRAAVRD